MKKKMNYTKEFKVKACELVLKDEVKVKTVAEKMGINHIMLYRWIDEYKTYGEAAFVGKGYLKSEDAKLLDKLKHNGQSPRIKSNLCKLLAEILIIAVLFPFYV